MRDNHIIPVSGHRQSNFAWDLRSMVSAKLPWKFAAQVTGRYNSRQLMAQGTREAGWDVRAGIRKDFGSLSVSLNCRDIFNSRRWHNVTYGEGYTQHQWATRGGRCFSIDLKYSFGVSTHSHSHNVNKRSHYNRDSYEECDV